MVRIKKVYPIKGRKDFFKYVIMDNGAIAIDFNGKEMYFDSLIYAKDVAEARRKVHLKMKKYAKSKTSPKR